MDTEHGPITDEQLAAWEALCEQATPGPWEWNDVEDNSGWSDDFYSAVGLVSLSLRHEYGGKVLCTEPESVLLTMEGEEGHQGGLPTVDGRPEDLNFITTARIALPALLAEVRRLRAGVPQ